MLPVIPRLPLTINSQTRRNIGDYAARLAATRRFAPDKTLRNFAATGLVESQALVLDDFTDVALFQKSSLYIDQRARLRATDGDIVATISAPDCDFDNYLSNGLSLGKVDWLEVAVPDGSFSLANHCWQERDVRREIVHAIRSRDLQYIHPHMGNSDVWRLAQLLSKTAHRDVQVIGPPPAVAHWANDKVAFAEAVGDLLGESFVPLTESAHCRSVLAKRVEELARENRHLAIKVPHAAGGNGNFFLDALPLREMTLTQLNEFLRERLPPGIWPKDTPLLVDVWESDVLESASIQTWIPPVNDGEPVLEGIFSQMITGMQGKFTGCIPLQLPERLERIVVEATSQLVVLFQNMGYVGRCSFDFLVVGDSLDDARVEFIECNGRWGGTSVPMMVINRVFGDYSRQPFAAVSPDCGVSVEANSNDSPFCQLVNRFSGEIVRKSQAGTTGWLIPFNTGLLNQGHSPSWIVLGDTFDEVRKRVSRDLPALLNPKCAPPHTCTPVEGTMLPN